MNKEQLEQEYAFWKLTIINTENRVSTKPSTQEEITTYSFAKGFVSAVDKSGILKEN